MAYFKTYRFITLLRDRLGFLNSKKQWRKGILCFLVVFALIAWLKDHVCLLYSATDSLPYRTFLKLKNLEPRLGDYTCIESPWYGGTLVKKLIGTAGDAVTYDEAGNLWINRQLRVGKPQKQAKDGRVLTPLEEGIIPKGKVFVMGDHERSFDSRYEELGLVPEQALQGRVIALL